MRVAAYVLARPASVPSAAPYACRPLRAGALVGMSAEEMLPKCFEKATKAPRPRKRCEDLAKRPQNGLKYAAHGLQNCSPVHFSRAPPGTLWILVAGGGGRSPARRALLPGRGGVALVSRRLRVRFVCVCRRGD